MLETQLQLHSVSKAYVATEPICKDISFSLKKGEIGCLLGPSGCGKTTLLRIVAGFEGIDSGKVVIGGREVATPQKSSAPEKRCIGMVFQDYALFPHLSVWDNVCFGASKTDPTKINELLELVGLTRLAHQFPHQLSGGQQQRVALARALAPQPQLLLLDEPFSNLDVVLRNKLTVEIRNILKELGTTALLVTHNQREAFSVADKIGVIFDGQIQQWDSAYTIYHRPKNVDIAHFVGSGNLLKACLVDSQTLSCVLGEIEGDFTGYTDKDIHLFLRPENITLSHNAKVRGKIKNVDFQGAMQSCLIEIAKNEHCQALVPSHTPLCVGQEVGVVVDIQHPVLFKGDAQ